MGTEFESISKIDVNANGVTPLNIGDVDVSSMKDQEKIRYSQDTKYRRHLTQWVMHLVPLWLIGVFVVVCLCASGCWKLSDIAFSALLTTMTANILGLAYIVLRGMFPQKKDKI